ncbi:leucine rich repeat protein, putative [Eimeria maxima]|uniref:Leucine rich repeat protein, putative n=1 Tax=Eimeria maxima TaxID=5804 RepID=U6M022_EIMMA|nr:leucine rich repeat protein, putative [Eimeria maxima]CDJ56453.1 leucine rich repeat protein, putative [Eimeria maxima]
MKITEDLIRRKSEHNEGSLEDLEEIALHQLEIEKIELLDRLCKDLKILLLQNNLIDRLENLRRLKRLEYLNVALNNIVVIENLERWTGFRSFTIATLLQLKQLDGKVVTPVERIQALRALPALKEDLAKEIRPNDSENAYTRENRKRMYQEMAHKKPFETYNSKGEIRQCNQGRLKFTMDSYSQPGLIVVTFELPRHLSTMLIDVDVHPNYLRVTVKGKVTQLRLPEDISPDNTKVRLLSA